MDPYKYFLDLSHNKHHHIGLGDVRLTVAQQQEIIEEFSLINYKVKKLTEALEVAYIELRRLEAIEKRMESLLYTLKTIHAQGSSRAGSTSRADCMAALAGLELQHAKAEGGK